MAGVCKCTFIVRSSTMSMVMNNQTLGLVMRRNSCNTLTHRSTTSSSFSCKSQLSPLTPSKPETTQHHEPQPKSVLLRQGLKSHHDEDERESEELIGKVKKMMLKPSSQRSKMELIDVIERLGVGHHFEEEIRQVLLESNLSGFESSKDLYDTALCFRMMRRNGLPASPDVFDKFIKGSASHDTRGMLSMYEASFFGANGEDNLLEAKKFAKSSVEHSIPSLPLHLRTRVAKSLELPRHLRMETLEAKSYIEEYGVESNHNTAVLRLAKLEIKKLQSFHKHELAEITRWWKELGLVDKLGFGRDRPFECFLWTVGIFPQASYSEIRIELTKNVCILLVLDDVFDTYGTLDELVLFNEAIKRWELSAMEQLPEYMKLCYMALYNTTNEFAYKVLKRHGWCVASHLKRTWLDVFEAFLAEAKWSNSGYTPSLAQYLENGVTSGGSYMALVHSFFLIGHGVTDQTVSSMQPYPEIFSCCGKILRLWDDLGTAKEEQERGDVASSIECYMRENDVADEYEARKQIRKMIASLWTELNGHMTSPNSLPRFIIDACFNLARTAQVIYQHGDDDRLSSVDQHVQSLFF